MKKRVIKFALYGVPLVLIIFQLINSLVLPFYLESELLSKIVIVFTILMVISVIIMVYGLDKIGVVTDEINSNFKKCKTYKITIKDFEKFQKQLEEKIKSFNYNSTHYQINNTEFINFYINKKENILTIITLIKVNQYNKNEYEKILNISQNFMESIYGDSKVKEYVKLIRILCVDKITVEFKEFVLEGIYLDINSETLPLGISFGSKKLFIKEKKKSIFDFHNEYLKQEELKNIALKLIDVEEILNKK